MTGEKKIYSLFKILNGVKKILDERVKDRQFWLRVELAKIAIPKNGHCYLEIVETKDGAKIAQCDGVIWKFSFEDICRNLGNDFGNIFKQGNEPNIVFV